MSQKIFLLVVLFLNYGTEPESQLGKNLIFAFLVSLTWTKTECVGVYFFFGLSGCDSFYYKVWCLQTHHQPIVQ